MDHSLSGGGGGFFRTQKTPLATALLTLRLHGPTYHGVVTFTISIIMSARAGYQLSNFGGSEILCIRVTLFLAVTVDFVCCGWLALLYSFNLNGLGGGGGGGGGMGNAFSGYSSEKLLIR